MSTLGALPIWVYGTKKHPNGFATLVDMIQTRLISSGSLTSTCDHYQHFQYDVLCNVSLSYGDSRQILNRGFQVDPESKIGLSV